MSKKNFLFVVLFCVSINLMSQTPQAISYQAVARNAQGNILSNTNVSLRVSILSGSVSGSAVYVETHNLSTNQFGLINIQIGKGTATSGVFLSIDWGANSFYSKVEIDVAGGSNYSEVGVSQILSVPYALYSDKARIATEDGDSNSSNELQSLSVTGTQLSISKGNTVTLPSSGGSAVESLTNAQRDALTNIPLGKMIHNSSTGFWELYDGTKWGGISITKQLITSNWTKKDIASSTNFVHSSDVESFVFQNKMYYFSNYNSSNSNFLYCLDLNTFTNTKKSSLPFTPNYAASIKTNSYAYVSISGKFYQYNPSSDNWILLNTPPSDKFIVIQNKVYTWLHKISESEEFYEYNESSDTWSLNSTFSPLNDYGSPLFTIADCGYLKVSTKMFEFNPINKTLVEKNYSTHLDYSYNSIHSTVKSDNTGVYQFFDCDVYTYNKISNSWTMTDYPCFDGIDNEDVEFDVNGIFYILDNRNKALWYFSPN